MKQHHIVKILKNYDSTEYKLFIDSGKGSFKIVLLNNENKIRSIPLFYSTTFDENQVDVENALKLIKYYDEQNKWLIICDIKMIDILLGIKVSNCNFPCFLCNWKQDTSRNKDKSSIKNYSREAGDDREFILGEFGVKARQLLKKDQNIISTSHQPWYFYSIYFGIR